MGLPISSICAEIFLQHYESLWIRHWLKTKIITYYGRYVDNIILMYDTRRTDETSILNNMNWIYKYLTVKLTTEEINKLNYFDLEITRKTNHVQINI
jgi:hypothetical protein